MVEIAAIQLFNFWLSICFCSGLRHDCKNAKFVVMAEGDTSNLLCVLFLSDGLAPFGTGEMQQYSTLLGAH